MTKTMHIVERHASGICSNCKERKVAVIEVKDENGKTHCLCDQCWKEYDNGG